MRDLCVKSSLGCYVLLCAIAIEFCNESRLEGSRGSGDSSLSEDLSRSVFVVPSGGFVLGA